MTEQPITAVEAARAGLLHVLTQAISKFAPDEHQYWPMEAEAIADAVMPFIAAHTEAALKASTCEDACSQLDRLREIEAALAGKEAELARLLADHGQLTSDNALLRARLAAAEAKIRDERRQYAALLDERDALKEEIEQAEQRVRALEGALREIAIQAGCCVDCVRVASAALTPPPAEEGAGR